MMIQLIVYLFSSISNGFYYLFWTSYTIGRLISWIVGSAINFLSFIWCSVSEAGTIFTEDFLIFLKDLATVAGNILDAGKDSIVTSCQFLYSIVHITFATIAELFTTGNVHTANVGQQCVNSFAAMMNAMKNLFVLIGNGSWFILTLVPTILLNIFTYIHHITRIWCELFLNIAETIRMYVAEMSIASVNYFLDVPLQAIIGCSFIVLLIAYRRITLTFLTWLTIRMLRYLQSRLLTAVLAVLSTFRRRNNNNRPRRPTRSSIPSGRSSIASSRSSAVSPQVSPPNAKQNSTEETVCVICRDEPKSVVLMPCRHMCLCPSCSGSIWTCPLCRNPIRSTLSVYT